MSDIPILTKKEQDPLDISTVMTELSKQTRFLSDVMTSLTKQYTETEKKVEKTTVTQPKDNKQQKESTAPKTIKDSPDLKGYIDSLKANFTEMGSNIKGFTEENFLGDTSFITKPIEQMASVFNIFKKKRQPKRSVMLKTNPEVVYLADALLDADKKTSLLDKFKGLLPLLLGGGALGAIGPVIRGILMKAAPIAMIAGGLLWMAIDGIKGYFKADEWGTSKGAAVVGSILGGTGSGWSGALSNMRGWAAIGGGIGMKVGGFPGLLIGGLIGAAIGGVLGYFGGEALAQGIDKAVKYVMNNLNSFLPAAGVLAGGIAGMVTLGPIGLVVGALLGGALGSLIVDLTTSKLDMKGAMAMAMKDPRVSALGGAAIGGAMGAALGPIGFLAGALLGAVFGGILGDVIGNKMISGQVDKFIQEGNTEELDTLVNNTEILDTEGELWGGLSKEAKDFLNKNYASRIKKVEIQKGKEFYEEVAAANDLFSLDKPEKKSIPLLDFWNLNLNRPNETSQTEQTDIGNSLFSSVNDAILRPDGSIVETDINDTIIATKNPVAFADKETNSTINSINNQMVDTNMNLITTLLKQLVSKPEAIQDSSSVLQQNFMSRYTPLSIMSNLTTEVF